MHLDGLKAISSLLMKKKEFTFKPESWDLDENTAIIWRTRLCKPQVSGTEVRTWE